MITINEKSVTITFIGLLILKFITQLYLSWKNSLHVKLHQNQVPEYFKDQISLSEHQKAAQYTLAKGKAGRFFLAVDTLFLVLWIFGGGLEVLDQWVRSWDLSPVLTGTLFFGLFTLIGMVLSLPEGLYETFVIEEKFGFNKTTKKLFFMDLLKQLILGALIGLPLFAALLGIMGAAGKYWWLYAWIFFTLVQFFLLWLYPTFIAPLFNKFSPLEEGQVKERILFLLQRTGFTSKGLFVMDASRRSAHGNAYFTGFGKNKRIVFFDNLIKTLEAEEVEAVLAHELGHFKLKHILKSMVKSIFVGLFGFWLLGQFKESPWFYHGHHLSRPSDYMALMLFMLVLPVYTFFLTPLLAWLSRKHEFEADEFAVKNARGEKLSSALVKMYRDNASTLTPDPLFSAFYHSHPPALQRVRFLEKLMKKN